MKITLRAFGKKTALLATAFVLSINTLSVVLFAPRADAVGPVQISSVSDLRNAIENQADGQTWTIASGVYGLSRFDDITVEGQTGWYFPITKNNITINGVGNPTLYGTGYSADGNWSSQNFLSVFGNNVTIDGLTLMPKVEPNKTIEVLGSDFTLRNTVITPNTLTDQTEYDNISYPSDPTWTQEAKQWGGSLYFSHAGNHVIDNVTIHNAGVSFRYAPAGTHITFNNVKVVDATNIDWINGYRFSSGFNDLSNTKVGQPSVEYHTSSSLGNLASVLANLKDGDTIKLDSDLTLTQQLTLTKAVILDGSGYTLKSAFAKTDNDNNSAMGIQSDNVVVSNLIVDGVDGLNLHGINVWQSHNVTLNDVSVKNNDRSGLGVNGSTVTVNNISTENNGWHGINVDKAGAVLTVNGVSRHSDALPIYIDDSSVGTVVDTNNQYVTKSPVFGVNDRVYTLKLVAPTIVSPENNSYTTNPSFDNVFTKVAGAVKYGYETTYYNGASSYIDTSDSGNYDLSGTNVIRHNNGAPEATYKWRVRAIDAFGIPGAWSEYSYVTVDKTAPSTPVHISPASNAFINNNDFWFDWSDVSGAVSYEMQNSTSPAVDANGSFQNVMWTGDYQHIQPTASTAHSVGASGTWYWQVRAVDAAGNKSAWTTPWAITLDMTAPVAPTLSSPADGATVNGASVTQSWNASSSSDVHHYIYESYNDASASSLRWNQTVSGLSKTATNVASSTFWWRVKAVDTAGNESAWSPLWKLTVDNTAPTTPTNLGWKTSEGVVITSGSATNDENGVASWNASSSSDVDHYIYKYWNDISGNPYKETSPWTTTISGMTLAGAFNQGEGAHYFSIAAVDGAGNTSAFSAPFKVLFDKTAPTITVNSIANSTNTQPTITGTTSELGGDVTIIVDSVTQGTVTSDAAGNWSWTPADPLTVGSHTIVATATDVAGNTSTATTLTDQPYWKQFSIVAQAVIQVPAQGAPTPVVTALQAAPAAQAQTIVTPDDTAVLGEQDSSSEVKADTSSDQAVAGASDKKSADVEWNLFGIVWYWWLVALAVLMGLWWAIAAWRHRKNEE